MGTADRNSPLQAAPDPAVPQHRLVRRPRRAHHQDEGQTQDQDQDVHLYMLLLLPQRSRLQRPGRRSALYGPEQAEAERRRRRRGAKIRRCRVLKTAEPSPGLEFRRDLLPSAFQRCLT